MKILKLLLVLSSTILIACSNSHNEKGYVVQKNHKDPYITTMISFIYTGKSMIPVTHIIYHKESWSLDLRDEINGTYEYYLVYLKNEEIWNQISVGDYFIWDENFCLDCEPTTEERQ